MKIIKSYRKTLSMKFDERGELIVKVPIFASKKSIEDFIDKNRDWIEEKRKNIFLRLKKFTQGEKFFFFGVEYELLFDNKNNCIFFDWNNFFIHQKHHWKVKEKLIKFYKDQARGYIEKRIVQVALNNNLDFNSLKITSAKTRWWSCTSKKNINFSYRLIWAPRDTIDYVIIHELSHLVELNHSEKFRSVVKKISENEGIVNYKEAKRWLNKNGNLLMF